MERCTATQSRTGVSAFVEPDAIRYTMAAMKRKKKKKEEEMLLLLAVAAGQGQKQMVVGVTGIEPARASAHGS